MFFRIYIVVSLAAEKLLIHYHVIAWKDGLVVQCVFMLALVPVWGFWSKIRSKS